MEVPRGDTDTRTHFGHQLRELGEGVPTGSGDDVGRSGAVTAFDRAGAPIRKYRFTKAWPKSLEVITTFDAGLTPTISERLVLVCERIEPE